jgi:uncharacterized Tic20 family protein
MRNEMTDIGTIPFPHIYRPKWWIHAINIACLAFMSIFLVFTIALVVVPLFSLNEIDSQMKPFMVSIICVLAPVLILYLLMVLFIMVVIVSLFFAYIKITPEGIEYRYWPYMHIRSAWIDVDSLGKYLFNDILYLNQFEKLGTSFSLLPYLKQFQPEKRLLPLGNFTGWKNGALEEDIRKFAPRAFTIKAAQPQVSGFSQNERVLAAISHASIFVSFPGMIVPIVIWIAERGKSPYAVFHAAQATVWQLIIHLLTVVFSVILSILIVVFTFFAVGTENTNMLSNGAVIQGIVLSAGILLISVLVFAATIYSTIAVIQTARGKDFRYPIIGNLIKRK